MKLELIFAVTLGFLANAIGQSTNASLADYESNKTAAEQLYSDKSFAKAHDVYAKIDTSKLLADDARWVAFRLADTEWRAQAGTTQVDSTKFDEARAALEHQIRDLTREDQHDHVWAEVEESLGDFYWTRRNNQDWGGAWPHYQAALDWWAGAPDIDLARERYLAMVWRMETPTGVDPRMTYIYWGRYVPLDVLDNALKIAQTDNDKAHAHYLIAATLRNQGGSERQRARVPEEFEGALAAGKNTDWYDDALYNYAEWMATQGRFLPLDNGGGQWQPDYVKALEMFRRVVTEFKKGETRYWEQAQAQIRNITQLEVNVSVGNVFLPDSEIQFSFNWRNVKKVDFTLYPVDLNRDVQFPANGGREIDWLHSIKTGSLEKIKSWSRETGDKGDYKPGGETVRYDGKLKPGAYLLEARGAGVSSRELILVTDATVVLKTSRKQALVYVCNALDSSPLSKGKVQLWERWYDDDDRQWRARSQIKDVDTNGIAVFDLTQPHNADGVDVFASSVSGDRQAYSESGNFRDQRDETDRWRIYATTDRPAYRPKETVNWKFIVRRYDGSVYSTPANQKIHYRIHGPDNAVVKEDDIALNAFGSAFGSLDLTDTMRLGEYRITFSEKKDSPEIGSATLFRLEEYKLPEFKVEVSTPEENGQKKIFRVGDKVEVTVQADYYFGGPVSDANVEVVVHQSPYYHEWHEPHVYRWYYDDMDDENSPYGGRWGRRYYGGDQIIKQETVKTDATGKATLTFDTPENAGQDFEYRIEARVTDSRNR